MENLESAKVLWELKELISSAALVDLDLRKKLISNPNETVESIFPGVCEQGLTFKVVEESDNELIIALPPVPPQSDEEIEEELSEEQLAGVSGGLAFAAVKAVVIAAIVKGAKVGTSAAVGAAVGVGVTKALEK